MSLRETVSPVQVIPSEWKLSEFGEFVEQVKLRNSTNEKMIVLSVTNNRGIIPQEKTFTKKIHSENLTNYLVVKKGQFAFNPSRINVGSIGLLRDYDKGLLSPIYTVFEVKNGIDPEFLDYFLKSKLAKEQIRKFSSISIRAKLTFDDLSNFEIALPPFNEQRKIGEILRSVDEVVHKTDQIIATTQQFRKGLTQQLLTKGIGHANFKKKEIGAIPDDWSVVELADVLTEPIRNGYSPRSPRAETGKWVLTLSAVSADGFRPDQIKPTPLGDANVDRCRLREGDILVSRSNTRELVGLSGLYLGIPANCSYPDLMMRIRVDEARVDNIFLEAWLRHPISRKYLTRNARGTSGSMLKINGSILSKLPVPIPSLSEQKEIAKRLASLDASMILERNYNERIQRLKKGLMQVLFAGKVKVKVN